MKDLVILEDTTLAAMAGDAKYRALIPCLQAAADSVKNAGGSCSPCKKKSRERQGKLLSRLRNCIRELLPAKRTELKKMLDTKRYRLIYRNEAGVVMKTTY